jgi:FHS family L-fucose permease-like MFS transporter
MWGFITCMNDILIPYVKKVFELSRTESMLIQFAFFTAYFVGSLIYFLLSLKRDPISVIGYKNGIIAGLIISALGTLLFYPAAELKLYGLFLGALFVLGLGFTLLQISANPYVAVLGPSETSSSRLNLSQGFNSLGTTIAPIVGGYLVFHYFAKMGDPLLNKAGEEILTDAGTTMSAMGVQLPYMIFTALFLCLAVLIWFSKLPEIHKGQDEVKGFSALKHRHLVLGMVAIFMYVGGEVSIGSVLISYMGELLGLSEMDAKSYLALYWGGAMIGRFLGAISLSEMRMGLKKAALMTLVAAAVFLTIFGIINLERTMTFNEILPYIGFIILNLLMFRLGSAKASRTLMIFSLVVIVMLITTMLTTGKVALWCVLSIGLFNSIMWSNIFTLAIKGLGKYTSQGSSLLVMMILGGAIIPIVQGAVADMFNGYHYSFFVPMICYIYLAYYGWKGHHVKIKN